MFKIKHAVIGCLFMTVAASVFAQELYYAKRAGGTISDQGWGIAVDAEGNSVVTGYFSGSASFGAGDITYQIRGEA